MSDSWSYFDESKIPDDGYVVERTPTVLLLDISASMSNGPEKDTSGAASGTKRKIDYLNEGLESFESAIEENTHSEERVDIATVTFGGEAEVAHDFEPFTDWTPPRFEPGGTTPMAAAIDKAVEMIDNIKRGYRQEGITYTRPLLWLVTDGKPDMDEEDTEWRETRALIQDQMAGNHLALFPLGIDETDVDRLDRLVGGTDVSAKRLDARRLAKLFEMMSNSFDSERESIEDWKQWDT